jgi:hypothetical protein
LIRALADLFDLLGPTNRIEAEEELRSAGTDPAIVGARMERLADDILGARPTDVGRDNAAMRARREAARRRPHAVAWVAIAATAVAIVLGWHLLRSPLSPQLQASRSHPEENAGAGYRLGRRLPPAANAAGSEQRLAAQSAPTSQPTAQPPAAAREEQPAEPIGEQAPGNQQLGVIVNPGNLADYAQMMPDALQWAMQHGLQMTVVAPRRVQLPRAYRDATAQYSGAVGLGEDHLSLEHYVAGLPFPHVDPNDPDAAVKIMWNYEHRPFATDDLQGRGVKLESGPIGRHSQGMDVQQRVVIEAFQRLFYDGRLFVDPRPELPNPERVRLREGVFPVGEPANLSGDGLLTIRYQDGQRDDDVFAYTRVLRRVRKVSPANRSDGLFDTDLDLDSFFGFSGNITKTTWQLLGETVVLGCMHAQNIPVKWGEGSADFAFDDVWEARRVWVVEGVSKSPYYMYGKRILFIDQETWMVLLSSIHNSAGEPWKILLNMFRAGPSAMSAVYGSEINNPATVMIDTKRDHVTRLSIGAQLVTPGDDWFVNEGLVSESSVDLSALTASGKEGR